MRGGKPEGGHGRWVNEPAGGAWTAEELRVARERDADGRYVRNAREVAAVLGRKQSQVAKVRSGVDL